MRVRRLTPFLAAAAVAGFAGTGCAEQFAAVRVGDQTLSEADVVDELDAYGDNPALLGPNGEGAANLEGDLAGSYDQAFVSEIVQQRIVFLLTAQVFDDEGFELSGGDRAQAEAQLSQQLAGALEQFPDDYRSGFVDDVARYNILATELGQEELQAALTEAAATTDIHVNSRFGRWDEDQLAVVPPEGPTPEDPTPEGATPEGGGDPGATQPGG